jgi:hypothetical protein
VVDVTHDRDDWRAIDDVLRTRLFRDILEQLFLEAPHLDVGAEFARDGRRSGSRVELMVRRIPFMNSLLSRALTLMSSLSARSFAVIPSANVIVREIGGGAADIEGCDCRTDGSRRCPGVGRGPCGRIGGRCGMPGRWGYGPPGRGGMPGC